MVVKSKQVFKITNLNGKHNSKLNQWTRLKLICSFIVNVQSWIIPVYISIEITK